MVIIECLCPFLPVDQLALYEAAVVKLPDQVWSEAGYDLLLDVSHDICCVYTLKAK